MTRARKYTPEGSAAKPARERPALRLTGTLESLPSATPEDAPASNTGIEDLPSASSLQAAPFPTEAPRSPATALPTARRRRPVLRALRWAGAVVGFVVVAYVGWVLFALW